MNTVIKDVWTKYLKLWHDLSGWRLFIFYTLHYALLFIVLQRLVFLVFIEGNKTFIWQTDGLCSYIPRMIYISQTIRNGIQSLLSGDGWTIPLYDFRLGAAQLDLQVEPIQWLAVLWPWDKIDKLYDILVLVRYFLVGLSFSVLGFYFKQKPLPIMIGAVSYTFCGFGIYGGVRHPFFLAQMILLPLLIVGAETILKGEKGFLFTFVVFVSLISNLYFSCMLAILVFIYIAVRYFCVYANNGLKGFAETIARSIFWGGTGIALSCIVTIPTLLQMLGTGRIGRNVGNLSYYSKDVYERFFTSFIIIPDEPVAWTLLGFSVFAVPAVILLFVDMMQNKNIKSLKILFIVLTIMLCFPAFTYMMSGFNAISGRWCFGYALCVAAVIMFELPRLQNRYALAWTFGITVAYILVCYFVVNHNYYYEAPLVLLLLSLLLFICCYYTGKQSRKIILPVCLVLTCVSVCYSAFLRFDSSAKNYAAEYMNNGTSYETYMGTQYGSLGQSTVVQKDLDFFRVSASSLGNVDSSMAFYWGLNGLSLYTSSIVESYKTLENSLEIAQRLQNNWKFGIEGRAPVLSLFNIKYYAARGQAAIPYGFTEVDKVNKDSILENNYFLPVGYTYDNYMLKEEFDTLTSVEKQEAMLQAVVLEEKTNNILLSDKNIEILSEKMPVEILNMQNVTWQDGVLKVNEEGGAITLAFDGLPGADTYLRVLNLDLTSGNSARNWNLTVTTDNTSTYARFGADGWLYSNGMKTQLMYLGNSPDGYTTCTLIFPQKGTFLLDDLEIWCQPMDNYAAQIEALRAESLENIEINWRGLTGTVSLSENKIMCFGIPYEKAWSVYVDGEKKDLMQANIGLMALALEAGEHTIELKYWTPGLTVGIIISCLGLVLLIGLILFYRKNK